MKFTNVKRGITFLSVISLIVMAVPASAQVGIALVTTGTPAGSTPDNHQNEPAVAMDANNPSFLVAGSNDFGDWAPCPQADATQTGNCFDPADNNVGLSGVYFSFDSGAHWIQPTYTGWTAADCNPTSPCTPHVGPIHTLPWYYENGLVSSGDPAVAVGPIRGSNGHFSWSNGSRVYYANLVGALDFPFPNRLFNGFLGVAVSRLDNPTPANVTNKNSWQQPVLVNTHAGQTAFEDKEQVWADNASSSPFFGNAYVCSVQFRSVGQHRAPGGNFPAPLMVSVSSDGGTTWSTKQITPAGTGGRGPTQYGLSGCTVRTDSNGVVYVFSEMFQNPVLVGLPTHGYHVMFKSYDGGAHWTHEQIIRQITDPCYFADPIYGRCVMDGYAGARTDLSAAPSIDIANGAPTGQGATNAIVDAWSDAPTLNGEITRLMWSTNGGGAWQGPVTVSLPGDRPLYSAPAISPIGDRVYVMYEAVTSPWRGADMSSPRPYHGVFRTATFGPSGPGSWSTALMGALGDLRATYPGHDLYQERIGDYVYAAASRQYGVGVWTDAANAAVCGAVQNYRAGSLAAGHRVLPAPWPLADCPATFGNTDIVSASTAP